MAVGAVLSGLALYLQEYVVPEANNRVRVAWWDEIHTQGAGLFRLKGMQIPIGQGKSLYFQDFDMAAKEMVGVRITAFQGEVGTFLFAERGTWEDKTLTLKDYRYYQVDFAQVPGLETAPDLLAQVRRVFRVVSQGKTLEVTSDLSRARAIADYADTFSFGQDSLSEAWRKLKDPFLPPLEKWRARLELHSKLALPLANLVLVLLAAAMALRYGKSPGLALGMSVVLALAYYGAFFLGRALAGIGALPPSLGPGGPTSSSSFWASGPSARLRACAGRSFAWASWPTRALGGAGRWPPSSPTAWPGWGTGSTSSPRPAPSASPRRAPRSTSPWTFPTTPSSPDPSTPSPWRAPWSGKPSGSAWTSSTPTTPSPTPPRPTSPSGKASPWSTPFTAPTSPWWGWTPPSTAPPAAPSGRPGGHGGKPGPGPGSQAGLRGGGGGGPQRRGPGALPP